MSGAFFLLLGGTALAAHPLVTDDTVIHAVGKYQLEMNGEAGYDRQRQGGVVTKTATRQVAAILSAGIAETVDIVVGLPWQWHREEQEGSPTVAANGGGDASLELKWRFFERPGFSLAVKPGITLPTGDARRGAGNGRICGGVTLIATKELAPVALHLNATYFRHEFRREQDRQTGRRDSGRVSLAAQTEIVKNLQLAGEIGLERNGERSDSVWPAFVVGGVIYSLHDALDLDLGLKKGLTDPAPDMTLLAGLSWHF